MPDRSLAVIDDELSVAVKARASARSTIRQLSDVVIANTRKIDELLAERCDLVAEHCPDTLAGFAPDPAAPLEPMH